MNYRMKVALMHGRELAGKIAARGAGLPPKPNILELMITSACDARCVMCNIWKNRMAGELSLDEIDALLSDPVLSGLRTITLAGGEPTQRPDILDICRIVADRCRDLLQVYMSTNGLESDAIAQKVASMLEVMPHIRRLRIGVSFDHIGERHDRIRGRQGNHANALKLVEQLRRIRDRRLSVQGNVTIAPYNVSDLPEIRAYFRRLNLKVFWFPISVSENFYENLDRAERFAFRGEQKKRLQDFIASLRNGPLSIPDYYYYTGLLRSLVRGKRAFPCAGGSRFLLVNPVGDVYPCYIFPKACRMGSIREAPLSEIWRSAQAGKVRAQVCNSSTCDRCVQWYDGFALSHHLTALSGVMLGTPFRMLERRIRSWFGGSAPQPDCAKPDGVFHAGPR